MVVDDSRQTLQLLSRMLYRHGLDVRPIADSQVALVSARKSPPDLAVLDISMSGVNGYELCHELKSDPATAHVPIIFISALEDTRNKVKAFQVGAVDFISKPFKFQEVLARIKVHLALSRKIQELSKLAGTDSPRQISDDERLKSAEYIAHDIRNPLHVISLNLAMLKKQIDQAVIDSSLLDSERLESTDVSINEYFERINRNLQVINRSIAEFSD